MTAEDVEQDIAGALDGILDAGLQPVGVHVGVAAYKALLARDGLQPRSYTGKASGLVVTVAGFLLPVDCKRTCPDGDAWVSGIDQERGSA